MATNCKLSTENLLCNATVWHAHDVTDPSCAFNRNASIPVVPQILVTLSYHLIPAILCRQQRWTVELIIGRVSRSHNHTAV